MKLIKVRDNQNRPVSTLDIMMGAVFGGEVPREFVSGEHYDTGEHVYIIDRDGNLKVMICNSAGTFLRCEDPNFSEWSLNDSIQKNYDNSIITNDSRFADTQLYNTKSMCSDSLDYLNGNIPNDNYVRFSARVDGFNLNDYSGEHDIVEVYLRREHSDSYLLPSDYTFDGENITIELPFSEMASVKEFTSNFYPEGRIVNDSDNTEFWYGEDLLKKTFDLSTPGISLIDFDILAYFHKRIDQGYKICNLRVEAINTLVASPLNGKQDKDVYHFDTFMVNGNHTAIGSDVSNDNQTIKIPIQIEPDRNIKDELTVTLNTTKQKITVTSKNGYIKQVKFSLTTTKLKPLSVFVIGNKARSGMTNYIGHVNKYGNIVEIDGQKLIEFPCFDLLRYNSFDFELYVNRTYTCNYEEYIDEDGKLYIRMLDESTIDYNTDLFIFHIFYSICQEVGIIRSSDEQLVTNEKEAFRIFLTTEFVNKFQWLKLREDFKLIPPEYVVGSKGIASITNSDYYIDMQKTIRSDVFSVILSNIERRNKSAVNSYNSESYPILETTKKLPIPFIDYDMDKDDFLIFKSGGVLLSSAKYYMKDYHVYLYGHESPLGVGDYVDFRLLDRDNTVRIYRNYLTIKSNKTPLDIGVDIEKCAFFLLFTISGEFISPSKYNVNETTITFKQDCHQPFIPNNGTRVEVVYGTFKNDHTKTMYSTFQITATEDNQRRFSLDNTIDYGPGADCILIFREDGMYVGEKFYYIDDETDTIVIDKGTPVPRGQHIDIVVIRNLSLDMPVLND